MHNNFTIVVDADDPAPTLILRCGFCLRDLDFYGDGEETVEDGSYTLGQYDIVRCACGASYGEDDVLEVVPESDDPSISETLAKAARIGEISQAAATDIPMGLWNPNCVSLAFQDAERELGERIGYPALVYQQEEDVPPFVPSVGAPLEYTDEDIAYYSKSDECRRDVQGNYWQICGAPGDGPCHCNTVVRAHTHEYMPISSNETINDEPIMIYVCKTCGHETSDIDDGSDIKADLDRLEALVDKHGTVEALRAELDAARAHIRALMDASGRLASEARHYRDAGVGAQFLNTALDAEEQAWAAARAWLEAR